MTEKTPNKPQSAPSSEYHATPDQFKQAVVNMIEGLAKAPVISGDDSPHLFVTGDSHIDTTSYNALEEIAEIIVYYLVDAPLLFEGSPPVEISAASTDKGLSYGLRATLSSDNPQQEAQRLQELLQNTAERIEQLPITEFNNAITFAKANGIYEIGKDKLSYAEDLGDHVNSIKDAKRLLTTLKTKSAADIEHHEAGHATIDLTYNASLTAADPNITASYINRYLELLGYDFTECCIDVDEDHQPISPTQFFIDLGESADAENILQAIQNCANDMIKELDNTLKTTERLSSLPERGSRVEVEQKHTHDIALELLIRLQTQVRHILDDDEHDALEIGIADIVERHPERFLEAAKVLAQALQYAPHTAQYFQPRFVLDSADTPSQTTKMRFIINGGQVEEARMATLEDTPEIKDHLRAIIHTGQAHQTQIC